MTIDTNKFKTQLEEEKSRLESELSEVARKNPDNGVWEAIPAEHDASPADENIQADAIEGYEDNQAIVTTLSAQYKDVELALENIDNGSFGMCEVCSKEIESDRLEANPSARTCKEHMM